jgi:hypothetical protein
MHSAAKFQFERVREFSRWRAVAEDKRIAGAAMVVAARLSK